MTNEDKREAVSKAIRSVLLEIQWPCMDRLSTSEFFRIADAAISAIEQVEGWRPISEYKIGQQVLCGHSKERWVRFGIVYAALRSRWYYSGTSERSQYGQSEGDAPTHWRLLPSPPGDEK